MAMRSAVAAAVAALVLMLACASGGADGAPKGQQIYRMHCELCHGRDGKLGLNGAKDLSASTLTRAEMIAQVANGKGKMMPYKGVLTAKEIEAVVDYARALGKSKP
ncbi:MAG: c-type cytochrome [Flavobacteriales bacterium]